MHSRHFYLPSYSIVAVVAALEIKRLKFGLIVVAAAVADAVSGAEARADFLVQVN